MTTLNEIKIGDYIKASYKYSCVSGIITKINKNTVIISQCKVRYNEITKTNNPMSITKSRIYNIGLEENDHFNN